MYEEDLQSLCFLPEFLGTALLMLVAWEAFLRKLWSEAQIPVGSSTGGGISNPTGGPIAITICPPIWTKLKQQDVQ